MARALLTVPNVDGVSADYPKGRVRDKAGAVAGTTYTEVLHGDIIQLMQKLLIDAGITENGNPDNVTNGYQFLDALVAKIKESTKVSATLTTERATAAFDSGTITITAEAHDRMIYVYNGGTVSVGYGVAINVDGSKLSRIDSYQAISYLLPAGLVSTIVWESGTATEFTVKSHKIGV